MVAIPAGYRRFLMTLGLTVGLVGSIGGRGLADDANQTSLPSLGAAAGSIAPIPSASQPATSKLQSLRVQQQVELQQLRDNLRVQAQQPGSNVDALKQQYIKDVKATRDKFLTQDTRGADIQQIETDSNGAVKNTGSAPKDVRADVDLAATTHDAAQDLVQKWKANGDVVEKLPGDMGYVNKTTDTTLWNPCESDACKRAKIKYYDSFGTPGGQAGTGNTTQPGDPAGFAFDNEKKFYHALHDDDLKTAAKSVDKAADQAGIKDPDDPFWKQTKQLRDYADPVEAGIAEPGDPPDVQKQKVKDWLHNAQTKMDEAVRTLQSQGVDLERQRQQAIDELKNSPNPDDQALAEQLEKNIADTNKANAQTSQDNLASRNGTGDTHPTDMDAAAPHPTDSDTANSGAAVADSAVGNEAVKGALTAAVAQFLACAAQMGIDRYEYTRVGAQTIGQCFAQVASLEGVKGMGEGAIWGAIAASGPAGALIAAAYGAGQGAVQIGKAGIELGRTGGAINEMWQNERIQQQQGQANCADADALTERVNRLDTLLRGFDADCNDYDQVCQTIISGQDSSAGQSDRARQLRAQLAGEKSSLNVEIIDFSYAYSACQNVIQDQLLSLTGRISQSASVLDRNPNCGSSAPAGQDQNVQNLMTAAQDPNSILDVGNAQDAGSSMSQDASPVTDSTQANSSDTQPSPPTYAPASQPPQAYAGDTTQAPVQDAQQQSPTASDWLTAIGAGLTGFANGVQMQNNAMAPAQQTYYPAPGYYNPVPRYNSSRPARGGSSYGNPQPPASTQPGNAYAGGTYGAPSTPQCPGGYSYQAATQTCAPLHTGCPPGTTPVQEADGRWCSNGSVEQPCITDPCW